MNEIEKLLENANCILRSEITDTNAIDVSWEPLSEVTANFNTAKLKFKSADRIQITRSAGMGCFALLFIIVGSLLTLTAIGFYSIFGIKDYTNLYNYLVPAVGMIFIAGGLFFLNFGVKEMVFDKTKGYAWQGAIKKESLSTKQRLDLISLKRIQAIQYINYAAKGVKGYNMTQLNLVLDDSKRRHIIGYNNPTTAVADAILLSGFLEAPIWLDDNK